jgi:hypothetical protein
MIQAILAGRKIMTRRLAAVPVCDHNGTDIMDWHLSKHPWRDGDKWYYNVQSNVDAYNTYELKHKYGRPGDLLWVRENFRVDSWMPENGEVNFRYEADGVVSPFIWFEEESFNKYWEQSCVDLSKAGYEPNDEERFEDYDYKALRLRPNIFLPKPAARIWLQVESVRVERLQDISEQDAISEGVLFTDFGKDKYNQHRLGYHVLPVTSHEQCLATARTAFGNLWEKINGPGSWQANPFVWVISFKVLSTNGKPDLKKITTKHI